MCHLSCVVCLVPYHVHEAEERFIMHWFRLSVLNTVCAVHVLCCVCMLECMSGCVSVFVCMCACVHVCTCASASAGVCVCVRVCIARSLSVCMCVCVRACVRARARANVNLMYAYARECACDKGHVYRILLLLLSPCPFSCTSKFTYACMHVRTEPSQPSLTQ
jgi:hypothetical protein